MLKMVDVKDIFSLTFDIDFCDFDFLIFKGIFSLVFGWFLRF